MVHYGSFFVFRQHHFAFCMRLWLPRFNYTTYPPFQAYAVEGWWLDKLVKGGKLSRQTYLTLAAQVTVGFAKRVSDCKAGSSSKDFNEISVAGSLKPSSTSRVSTYFQIELRP